MKLFWICCFFYVWGVFISFFPFLISCEVSPDSSFYNNNRIVNIFERDPILSIGQQGHLESMRIIEQKISSFFSPLSLVSILVSFRVTEDGSPSPPTELNLPQGLLHVTLTTSISKKMKRWQGKSFDKICGNLSQICPKNVVPLTYFCLSFDRWISDCMSKQWNKIFFIFRIEASILRFQVLEILIKKSFFSIPRILFLWSPQKEEEDFFDLIESVPSLQIYREEETPDKNSKFENIIKKEVYPKILQFEKGEIVQAKYPYEFNFFRPSFEEPKNLKLVIFLQIHNEAFITNGALRALFRSYYALEVQVYATVLSQKGLESMNSHFPFVHSVLWENKGMDIGAFMWQIEEYLIGKENLNRTIVLKWHTKSNTVWQLENSRFLHNRRELMISLDAFQTHHNLGMIGSGPCLKLKSMVAIPPDMMNEKDEALTLMKANFGEHSVGDLIREIEMVAFGRTTHLKEREYVPGSIFMVRASLLSSLYSGIGSKMWGQIIDNGPKGYATESQIHAMERIFGYSVGVFGYEFSCTRGRFLTKRQWWL